MVLAQSGLVWPTAQAAAATHSKPPRHSRDGTTPHRPDTAPQPPMPPGIPAGVENRPRLALSMRRVPPARPYIGRCQTSFTGQLVLWRALGIPSPHSGRPQRRHPTQRELPRSGTRIRALVPNSEPCGTAVRATTASGSIPEYPARVTHDAATELEHRLLADGLADQTGMYVDRSSVWGGAAGARVGARLGSRLHRDDRAERQLQVDGEPTEVTQIAIDTLSSIGNLVRDGLPNANPPETWAVVGVGWGKMNPAVVRLSVASLDKGRCLLTIRTVGKGRRSGAQAADLVYEQFTRAF